MKNFAVPAFWPLVLALSAISTTSYASPAPKMAMIDSARVEQESKVMQRIRAEAKAQQGKVKAELLEQSVEIALSELLTALPEECERLAEAQKLDLIVTSDAAQREKLSVTDLTPELTERLDARFKSLTLELE
jgi:Skp family chaperone for outer membrane proteins